MGHLKYTPYLTTGYAPDVAAKIKKTHAGMAYFADTGPFAATWLNANFTVRGSASATQLVRSSAPRG
jgi:hypothetical protein